ncbi:DUF5518 domain-containing protein [Halobacteria archaeon AArc-curdl1]|uniref:DUF5518 domain-containing protein n=1 Tax=Natronosalvus hydrolyticus TaxID=2979988 RepID=A0AAP2Z896_9EURY|nr:DUF5518 domain-containing protein [Halobacteria archaeon AArc-curdl1]
MGVGKTWINAVVGAVITIGLSFTGFSPLLGGGVAGYLQAEPPASGAKIGAISGVIAAIPLFLIIVLGFVLFAAVPAGSGGVPGGVELLVIFVVMLPMMLLWFVGLSAVGGYVGAYLHAEAR